MKDNETKIYIGEDEEEWYGFIFYCDKCEGEFMTSGDDWDEKGEEYTKIGVKYCPYCGRKIIGWTQKGKTTFVFEESKKE